MMGEREFDVVIVGVGVIGHSIAVRLLRRAPNLKVALLGDPVNSLMASRAAAGMLAPYGECVSDDRFFRFCRASLARYPEFIKEVAAASGRSVYLSMTGSLMPRLLAGEHWDGRLRFFRETEAPHEVWTAAAVRAKLPLFAANCGEAIWVGEGLVNSRELHDALAAAASRLGARILTRNATGFAPDAGRVAAVMAGDERIYGKKFVLACGSWSPQLAQTLGVSMPLKPVKGQMCRLRMEDGVLPYTVHGFLTYIAPWQGHGFVLGSTMEDRGLDPAIEEEAIQGLIGRASAVIPSLRQAPVVEKWTGMRPAAADQMPVMGKSSRFANLYYSTGHFRNGILQTPLQADYMADMILEAPLDEISEFSPARYQL